MAKTTAKKTGDNINRTISANRQLNIRNMDQLSTILFPNPLPKTVSRMYLKYTKVLSSAIVLASVSANYFGLDMSTLLICAKPIIPGRTVYTSRESSS